MPVSTLASRSLTGLFSTALQNSVADITCCSISQYPVAKNHFTHALEQVLTCSSTQMLSPISGDRTGAATFVILPVAFLLISTMNVGNTLQSCRSNSGISFVVLRLSSERQPSDKLREMSLPRRWKHVQLLNEAPESFHVHNKARLFWGGLNMV